MTENAQDTVYRTVRRPPGRGPNGDARQYLTETEVEELRTAARNRGRHGDRDATMILVAYRHGLRVSELVALNWSQIDWVSRTIHVSRAKSGDPARHPLSRIELQELKPLYEVRSSRFVFISERGQPFTTAGFAKTLKRVAISIDFCLDVHPHMLRHACGFKLANDGRDTRAIQGYLGHRQIQHTVRYTALSAERYRNFWDD